ncbi:MAG: NAD-dependent epimerase/dehydratase family protein [Candidatus Dormibacteria bacterium]
MSRVLVWPRSGELASVLAGAAAREGASRSRTLVNVALQPPNSLLHDGHAWPARGPRQVLAATRRALTAAAAQRAGFVVHASWALLQADPASAGPHLAAYMEAALEAEDLVLRCDRPASVVRLGYLYGPELRDLRAYRRAFLLRRPYWAGPRHNLQHHLHTADAATALIQAASARRQGSLTYATDRHPASFADLMDHFARLVGNGHPLHLPGISRPFVRLVVSELHQEQTELGMPGAAAPPLGGFTPRYGGYRDGLAQVIDAWETRRLA